MGMTEILVILVVAMIFLGPEKLPEAAAKISKGIREIRKQSRELQNTIETDTEIGGAIRDLKSALRGDEIRRPPVRKVPAPEAPPAPPLDSGQGPSLGATGSEPAQPESVASSERPAPSDPPERAAEPRVEGQPADGADPDDPIRLIRPAAGTAKRDHG
jgi:sec-independent protein translocase protein TatB